MLQQTEYQPGDFINWLKHFPVLSKVQNRKKLEKTKIVRWLLVSAYLGWILGLTAIAWGFWQGQFYAALIGLLIFPLFSVLFLICIVLIGKPFKASAVKKYKLRAMQKFAETEAVKIAVIGSYGKTTTKEILSVLLGEKHSVAVTPGNQNVVESQAKWALNSLSGSEQFLIVEFGEYRKGDIVNMGELVQPDYACVTGYAPNHIDSYGNEMALKQDLLSVISIVKNPNRIFCSEYTAQQIGFDHEITLYAEKKILGWSIEEIKVDYSGTEFVIKKDKTRKKFHVDMLGAHLVPTIVFCLLFAREIGDLSWSEIEPALGKLKPYPHRMQPILVNGAWVIDDTYNGNFEGIKAGLKLLESLPARRKIYVTPGLVEQGDQAQKVHIQIGQKIAEAKPDKVVLMHNSTTEDICSGLKKGGFAGEVVTEENPKYFYENLEFSVAAGDLIMMQNDWTDNYN